MIEKNLKKTIRPKICLIMPQVLPVPAVKGGAVETLAESIVKYNEKYKYLDLTIISIHDGKAVQRKELYPNTKFIFIKKTGIDKFTEILFRLFRKCFHKSFSLCTYDYKVLNHVKKYAFDRIVFEGGNSFFAKKYNNVVSKNDRMFHYHAVFRPNFSIQECFSSTIGISKYVTNEFIKNTDLNMRNYTLLNGIEINNFYKTNYDYDEIMKKHSLSKDDFVVLYVGRIFEGKGVYELAQACINVNISNIKLLIIGKGTGFNIKYINSLNKLVNKSNNVIQMVGYVDNEELYKYYNIANCVVMPSKCEEGAGLVQIEANACGKPTIVTNIGGIPEYATKHGTILIKLDDLINNIEQALLKVKNSYFDSTLIKDEVSLFSAENYYLNFVNIIEEDLKYGK